MGSHRKSVPSPSPPPDLVVVGAGVVGLAVARDAARRGMNVTVLERGRPGRESSWAAAGMLSPLGEAREGGALLELGLAGLEAWPEWIRSLEAETDLDVDFRRCGKLRVAFTTEEANDLEARRGWAQERGISHRLLSGPEARGEVPLLPESVLAGLLVEQDHRVENRLVTEALLKSAGALGVEILEGTAVRRVTVEGGRARGVVLDDGSALPAGKVLVAAGAWSGALGGLPFPLPVRPVRGQILSLVPDRLPSERILESDRVYLVPRGDGRVIVGATQEEVGFDRSLTAGGIGGLLEGAMELVPELAGARVHEMGSGLRPGTPDGNPVLGPFPGSEGLLVATGHFRNGILLAAVTARALGAMAAGDEGPALPPDFLPDRFADSPDPRGAFAEEGER
jgi:glycine oxidase